MISQLGWAGSVNLTPSFDEFVDICRAHREGSGRSSAKHGIVGETHFEPVNSLERLQSTISFDRILKALSELEKEEETKKGKLKYHDGASVYPKERRITGILRNGKIYIVDGHHRAFVSCYYGAEVLPVEIIADWSSLSEKAFHKKLREEHLAHFYGLNGRWEGPGEFTAIQDDPYLFLARKVLLRVDLNYDRETGAFALTKVRGSDMPIGFKINRDVQFFEQTIARVARRHKIQYKRGDEITLELLTSLLNALKASRRTWPLNQVLLLDKPTPRVELEANENAKMYDQLIAHFAQGVCEMQISRGDAD